MLSPVLAHATTNCDLASGASTSTIQSAVTAAGSNTCTIAGNVPNGHTVFFQAGSYSITSQINVPCPGTAVLITGPTPSGVGTTWPITPTANLTSTLTGNHAFRGTACTVGTTFQYFHYDGGNPAGGGGGFLFVPSNMNNLTVQWNVMVGVSALQNVFGQVSDSFIWLDGPQGGTPRTSNATIIFNKFGRAGDCGTSTTGIMNLFGGGTNNCTSSGYNTTGPSGGTSPCLYQGSTNYEPGGGYCQAVGVHVNTTNLVISNNSIGPLEQGMKFFEGCGDKDAGYPACVYSPATLTVNANDIFGIHRIALEAQMNGGFAVTNNDTHDNIMVGTASWSLSMPQGGPNQINNNLLIQNVTPGIDKNGQSGYWAAQGIEMWGVQTQANNNMIQGNWNSGIEYGYSAGPNGTTFNNIIQLRLTTLYIADEYPSANNNAGLPAPQSSGNVTGQTVTTRPSATPTISPAPTGTFSGTVAVIITDNGYTSGVGPQGNTSIYYTTDGSTPTTSSTWCASPCTIPGGVAAGSTVNAIGMWGALNQPRSYPSGYGFVPSPVAGAHYSAGSGPTVTGVTVTLQPGGSSILAGNSVQACANITYTGPQTTVVCSCTTPPCKDTFGTIPNNWISSIPSSATVAPTTGVVNAIAAGTPNLTVQAGGFTSPAFALTVTNPTPVLTGVTIADGGVSTISSTQTVQATATANYTNGPAQNCTATADTYGTKCGTWLSSTPAAATISSTGLISGVAAGSTNLTVKATGVAGNFTSAPLALTVTAPPPPATLVSVAVTCATNSAQAGNTDACAANCTYSDATVTRCTTVDGHGTTAFNFLSGTPATATIDSTTGLATAVAAGTTSLTVQAGAFTSPGYTLTVTAIPPVSIFLGDPTFDTPGNTSQNFINATYAVTGTAILGYNVTNCTFYLPAGNTYTAGNLWDCGLVPAPTPTTQATSWLCHNSYTNLGTSADVGWHTISLPTCGVLPPSTAYWVDVITNQTGRPGQGFSSCGGPGCTGPVPTIGQGTYPYRFVSVPYGTYTGMSTAMTATSVPGLQSSQYITLSSPTPTLTGSNMANPGPTVVLSIGGSVQFAVLCNYSDGTSTQCFPTPDQYGNTVTSFTTTDPTIVTIGNIGSLHPGLATGVSPGNANVQAIITGSHTSSPWGLVVSPSLPSIYPPVMPRGVR